MHGALSLHQLGYARPANGYARHRTPIDGLYLCGAGLLLTMLWPLVARLFSFHLVLWSAAAFQASSSYLVRVLF